MSPIAGSVGDVTVSKINEDGTFASSVKASVVERDAVFRDDMSDKWYSENGKEMSFEFECKDLGRLREVFFPNYRQDALIGLANAVKRYRIVSNFAPMHIEMTKDMYKRLSGECHLRFGCNLMRFLRGKGAIIHYIWIADKNYRRK